MINRPSNPFQDLVAKLFPEMTAGPMGQNFPKMDPNHGVGEPFMNGPATGTIQDLLMDMFEKPGAVRGFDGIRKPLTRGQKLMPGQGQIMPGEPYMPTVPNYGADRDPNDPMDLPPAAVWGQRPGTKRSWEPKAKSLEDLMKPDNRNPWAPEGKGIEDFLDPSAPRGPFVPSGFRMYMPGMGTASSGKRGFQPALRNDNLGGEEGIIGLPPQNDNNPTIPIPPPGGNVVPFKTGYTPAQQAMQEQGIDPNGPQAGAWAKLNGGQQDSPVTIQPKKTSPVVSQATPKQIVVDSIIGAESAGNARAKNPKSSASGLGQIIKGTWNSMKRKYPNENFGDFENGRWDGKQSRRMTELIATESEATLIRKGLPVTPGTIYTLHFLGEGSGPKVLSSPDNARMVDVIPADQISANGFLRNMTVGQYKQWADRKMAKGGYDRGKSGSGPGAGSAAPTMPGPDTSGGVGNYTAGLLPDEQGGGGGGGVDVKSAQAQEGPVTQDDGNAFLPYLQEVAQRRAAYKARRADRRSRIEELLAMGDQRSARGPV